jgi:1,4-alpha-glucan branching enzyme
VPVGRGGQVVVVANAGPQRFTEFVLPWLWPDADLIDERGTPALAQPPRFLPHQGQAVFALEPFQVRVFTT